MTARLQARCAASPRPRRPRCTAARRWAEIIRLAPRCSRRSSARRTAPAPSCAAACAKDKRNDLRVLAVCRRLGSKRRWPPARRSICSSTRVFHRSSLQHAAPLTPGARAVHEPLTVVASTSYNRSLLLMTGLGSLYHAPLNVRRSGQIPRPCLYSRP